MQCVRVFGHVSLMKTKVRNNLSTETVNGSLLAAQDVKEHGLCIDFKPPSKMLSKLNLNMYKRINMLPAVDDSD